MRLFQNYIAHIPYEVYEILLGEGIIDGLKFPGTGASPDANQAFIDLVKKLDCLVDNHGWNGITGQLHDPHFSDRITDFSGLENYLNLPNAWKFSSHIGARPQNLPTGEISQQEFDEILLSNLEKIRETIYMLTDKKPTIYGEGLFPHYYDPRTITPDFINRTLKSSGLNDGLDGLVLDICHSSIAAKYIEKYVTKNPYSFYDYVADLDTSQVKIIHISGNANLNNLLNSDTNDFKDDNNLDPHIRSSVQDFRTLNQILSMCPYVEQVSNEIAYSSEFGNPVTIFDYCSEAILTWFTIKHRFSRLDAVYYYISERLHKTCDNLREIISTCKSFV